MSGISLQQSILMNKNRSMSASLADYQDAVEQWKKHARILELDLAKQTKLLGLEKTKTKAMIEKADANGRRADLMSEKADLMSEKADLHQDSANVLEEAVRGQLGRVQEMRKDMARLERGLLLAKDKLSKAEKARINYSLYARSLYSGLTSLDEMGRSESQLRVLSGLALLEGTLTSMGAEPVRYNGIATSEHELAVAFTPLKNLNQKERKTKGIHEGELHKRKAGLGAGVGAAGDLHKERDPAYIGFPRATNRVMIPQENIREIAIRAIAWAEYQFFLDSNHDKAFLGIQTQLNAQIEQGLQAIVQATAAGNHEEVSQLAQTMQTQQQHIQQWQLTLQTLRQDARPFIVARIQALTQALAFHGDNDPQSDKEWHPVLESLPAASTTIQQDGEQHTITLLDLSQEEKEALMEITGVNKLFERLNDFFSDSHNYKNKQYTLANGTVVPIVDDSLKPKAFASVRLHNMPQQPYFDNPAIQWGDVVRELRDNDIDLSMG